VLEKKKFLIKETNTKIQKYSEESNWIRELKSVAFQELYRCLCWKVTRQFI